MDDLTKLKYWLDAEMSILHVYMLVIIGLIADSKTGWIICGILIALNFLYSVRRAKVLPGDYLKIKHKRGQ